MMIIVIRLPVPPLAEETADARPSNPLTGDGHREMALPLPFSTQPATCTAVIGNSSGGKEKITVRGRFILTSQPAPPGCPIRRTCRTLTSPRPRRRHYCRISRPCAADRPFGVAGNKIGSETVIEKSHQQPGTH